MLISVKTWEEALQLQKQGFELRSMSYWVNSPETFTYHLKKVD